MIQSKTQKRKIGKIETPEGPYQKGKGGRKTSTAQVRIFEGKKGFTVNGKDYKDYFKNPSQLVAVKAPLELTGLTDNFAVSALVKGGGVTGQAEAIRHGLAWALVDYDEGLKKKLKTEGFITRDPRVVERKKYGLRKARRKPQWSKR